MSPFIERHRIPLLPGLTLVYHRHASTREAISVGCYFRLGYADGEPGVMYALMKALQGQYAPAWRPHLTMTPDWSCLQFRASSEYRRSLDEQWLSLFALESALTDIGPLRQGLLHEQRIVQEAPLQRLDMGFQQLAFADTDYDCTPLGKEHDLRHLNQEQIFEAWQDRLCSAPLTLLISDSQPLHLVLERIRSLLSQPRPSLEPLPLPPDGDGPRERRQHFPIEGGWLSIGFTLPGMDQSSWIYGPVLNAWLQQNWHQSPPDSALQWQSAAWYPWQRASLLHLRFFTASAQDFQAHKLALVYWLKQRREYACTPEHYQRAVASVLADEALPQRPWSLIMDELQSGWGHLRHSLEEGFEGFEQALQLNLNQDRWVALETCSPQISIKSQPDHRQALPELGFSPTPQLRPQGRWKHPERLYLPSGQSLWVIPQEQEQLEIGVWFESGSSHETVPGTTRLLLDLLGFQFQRLRHQQERGSLRQSQGGWFSHVSADACFFKWAVPAEEWPEAIGLLEALLQSPLPELNAQHEARRQRQLHWLTQHLQPATRAHAQFLRSGFAIHPYAREVEGDYQSLLQVSPHRLDERWQALLQHSLSHVIACGKVSQGLNSESLAGVYAQLATNPTTYALPALRLRRGEIQFPSSDLVGFRYEGRLFIESLDLDDFVCLQMACRWVQDRIRSHWGLPVHCQVLSWREAWGFTLWGLYERQQRQLWWPDVHQVSEPLDMLQQRLLADWRTHQQDRNREWQSLIHWLSLGGSAGAWCDRERQLLSLRRQRLEDFLHNTWSQEQEWVQIVFHPAQILRGVIPPS